MFNYYFDFYFI